MTPIDPTLPAAAPADSEAPVAPAGFAPGAPSAEAQFRAKATAAAIKFESFFINNLLHQMRAGTRELSGEDSVFKNRANSEMLDLADALVADQIAGQRAFGIADAILRQLLPPAAPENLRAPLNKS